MSTNGILCLAMALAAACPLAGVAHAEIAQKSDRGFVSGGEIDVPGKSPVEVWQVLIAPATWWNPLHSWSGDAANLSLDPQAGGCFCETLPKPKGLPDDVRHGSIEHMRVIAAMPPKLLRLSGALGPLQGEALVGTLNIALKALPGTGGTHLTWSYVVGGFMRLNIDEIGPIVDRVMTEQIARLAKAAATGATPGVAQGPVGNDRPDDTQR